MVKMGSPSKDRDNKKHSKNVLKSPDENPVYHNSIRGQIKPYDELWEQVVHGQEVKKQEIKVERPARPVSKEHSVRFSREA